MKQNAKFFRDSFPEHKRKIDSFLLHIFYRPISFYGAALANQLGLTSNQVSFISWFFAVLGPAAFLFESKTIKLIGCFLVFVWIILDCVDGNLARSIKSYKYGDFIDAISSYTLIAVLFPCLGYSVFCSGGFIFAPANAVIVLIGAFTGMSDTLARLYYQKYQNNSYEYIDERSGNDSRITKDSLISRINNRTSKEIGLAGAMIPFLFVATIFDLIDIFVCFYFLFYASKFVLAFAVLLKKSKCLKK